VALGGHHRAVSIAAMRTMELFAERQSRQLSNVHQASLKLSLIGWREIEQWEFAQAMLPVDRALRFTMEPSGASGYLLMGRSLFFSLLSVNLGAAPSAKPAPIPKRAYTKIEERFLRKFGFELLGELERAWNGAIPATAKAARLVERSWLDARPHDSLFYATFDLAGFPDVCRLRIGIPMAPFAELERAARDAAPTGDTPIEAALLDMPLTVNAELGSIRLSLAQLTQLAVGDVFPVETSESGDLTVRIGDTAKFRAQRGSLGGRMAIQLTERVT
jgi:flagellar motor switch protein FliM